MAIETNDLIDKFGQQDPIDDGSTSAIANGGFSVAADITTWTNNDDAPLGDVIFRMQYPSGTFATSPHINIYVRRLNVEAANDEAVPDAGFKRIYVGSIVLDQNLATTTNGHFSAQIRLPNAKSSQEYDFYFENVTGVQISAGWAAWVTPVSQGPHPAV